MAQTVATTIQHDDNSSVYKVKKNSLIKEFSLVGRFNTMHSKNKNRNNIDIVDLMDDLTPTAINLFKMIKDNIDFRTNEATLEKPKGKYKQKRRSAAANALKQHKAIKKTGQRTYIINPNLIVPQIDFQEDILAKWDSLP
jgi:hypothetical protein